MFEKNKIKKLFEILDDLADYERLDHEKIKRHLR